MAERNEETIERIREARKRISEQFKNDPKRLVEHYLELQKQYQDRLLTGDTNIEGRDQRVA